MRIFQDYYFQMGLVLFVTWVIGFCCGKKYANMDEDEIIQKKKESDELEKRREKI